EGCHKMTLETAVDFFRLQGRLLEYRCNPSLNYDPFYGVSAEAPLALKEDEPVLTEEEADLVPSSASLIRTVVKQEIAADIAAKEVAALLQSVRTRAVEEAEADEFRAIVKSIDATIIEE
ncbi:unnamed protein product, partial [Polarella glacialis]